jgi:hypothetical protein
LPVWGRYDVVVMLELHATLGELISTRRAYDAGRQHQLPIRPAPPGRG